MLAVLFHDILGDPAGSQWESIAVRQRNNIRGEVREVHAQQGRQLTVEVVFDHVNVMVLADEVTSSFTQWQCTYTVIVGLDALVNEEIARFDHARITRSISDNAN